MGSREENKFARHGIMELAPYVAGKPIEVVKEEYGLTDIIKMASNENPLGVAPKALDAIRAEMPNCFMYPEGSSLSLRRKLAPKLGVEESQIFAVCGGDQVIALLGNAFIGEGDEVIVGAPSFFTYYMSTVVMGGTLVSIPLSHFAFDLDAILAAVTPKTKVIFFCNPNNPTGTIVGKDKVEAFMNQVPDHVVVVFDEAYFEYVQSDDYPNGVDYVRQGRNVVVLRTFSKAYGLAGLRIGYAIAAKHLAPIFGRVVPPFPVTRLSQVAAEAALDDTEFLAEVIRSNEEGRRYLEEQFARLGLVSVPSYGNFIYVGGRNPMGPVSEQLLRRGIVVRYDPSWGFPNHMRFSIGTSPQNRRLNETLEEILQES
jgi:histidinol-phosphate aminotransferase